jgi:hypothetical protein
VNPGCSAIRPSSPASCPRSAALRAAQAGRIPATVPLACAIAPQWAHTEGLTVLIVAEVYLALIAGLALSMAFSPLSGGPVATLEAIVQAGSDESRMAAATPLPRWRSPDDPDAT